MNPYGGYVPPVGYPGAPIHPAAYQMGRPPLMTPTVPVIPVSTPVVPVPVNSNLVQPYHRIPATNYINPAYNGQKPPINAANKPTTGTDTNSTTTTTVYVGKIPKTVPDDLIRKILECCGKLVHWNRVTNPLSGEFNAFGYAKFASGVDVLTALRVLNDFKIQDQNLLLKVGKKTQEYLDTIESHYVNGNTAEKDAEMTRTIRGLLDEYKELLSEGELDVEDPTMKAVPSVAGDRDKANIVTEEIKRFRELQAKAEKEKQEKQKKALSAMMEADRERERRFEREAARMRNDRLRNVDRDMRAKERDERDFRDREYRLELRENDKEKDFERYEQHRKSKKRNRDADMESELASTETWYRHVKNAQRKRERLREIENDRLDVEREIAQAKAEHDRKVQEQMQIEMEKQRQIEEQQRKEEEEIRRNTMQRLQHSTPGQALVANKLASDGPVKLGFKSMLTSKKRQRSGFLEDEDADADAPVEKKRSLIKLDYAEVGLLTEEDKQRNAKLDEDTIKDIAAQVPIEKDALFSYPINWDIVDQYDIVEKEIRSWVRGKVVEYCGPDAADEAKDIEDFVLTQLKGHSSAEQLFGELQLALGNETELFVKSLWRILIFHMISSSHLMNK